MRIKDNSSFIKLFYLKTKIWTYSLNEKRNRPVALFHLPIGIDGISESGLLFFQVKNPLSFSRSNIDIRGHDS